MMSLKKQHSKKGNYVSSNAGVSEIDLDLQALIFPRDIVDKLKVKTVSVSFLLILLLLASAYRAD